MKDNNASFVVLRSVDSRMMTLSWVLSTISEAGRENMLINWLMLVVFVGLLYSANSLARVKMSVKLTAVNTEAGGVLILVIIEYVFRSWLLVLHFMRLEKIR